MKLNGSAQAASTDARTGASGSETASQGEHAYLSRGRLEPSSDFNPLMERVMRAQLMSEGQYYRVSYHE